ELGREIALEKMESALSNSLVVSPKAAELEYKRMNENAQIRYVMLPVSAAAANVTVTPAEVEAYYKANPAKYTHGEQRNIHYLLADAAKLRLQINPSETELRRRYDLNKESFRTPESAHVLHILIKVDPNAPPAADQAARAKAESLIK